MCARACVCAPGLRGPRRGPPGAPRGPPGGPPGPPPGRPGAPPGAPTGGHGERKKSNSIKNKHFSLETAHSEPGIGFLVSKLSIFHIKRQIPLALVRNNPKTPIRRPSPCGGPPYGAPIWEASIWVAPITGNQKKKWEGSRGGAHPHPDIQNSSFLVRRVHNLLD